MSEKSESDTGGLSLSLRSGTFPSLLSISIDLSWFTYLWGIPASHSVLLGQAATAAPRRGRRRRRPWRRRSSSGCRPRSVDSAGWRPPPRHGRVATGEGRVLEPWGWMMEPLGDLGWFWCFDFLWVMFIYRNTWIWMAFRIGDVYVLCWWFDARISLGNTMWSIKVVVVGGVSFSFPLSNHTILGEWDWQAATCKGMICLFWFLRWCADLGAHGSAFLQVVLSFSAMCHGRRSPTHMSQIIHDSSGYGNKLPTKHWQDAITWQWTPHEEGNSVGIHGHVFLLFPDFKPGFSLKPMICHRTLRQALLREPEIQQLQAERVRGGLNWMSMGGSFVVDMHRIVQDTVYQYIHNMVHLYI
jgi:hypothetical protein